MTATTKTLATVGVGAAIIVGSMMAVTVASAHNGEKANDRAAEIAERFDLDEAEVKSFFEEKKQERMAEMEAKAAEHLTSLVEEGVLTQEQADALSAKKEEMKESLSALKEQDLTKEEWREQAKEFKDEFKAWVEEQGINLDDIRPGDGEGHRKGQGLKKQKGLSS